MSGNYSTSGSATSAVVHIAARNCARWHVTPSRTASLPRKTRPAYVFFRHADWKVGLLADEREDLANVILRFGERRNTAEAPNGAFAGVIRGQSQRQLELIEERAQVFHTRLDVRTR